MSINSITSPMADTRVQNFTAQQASSRPAVPTSPTVETATPTAVSTATAAAAAVEAAPGGPTALELVQQAMEDVRKAITPVAQDLLFSIDEDTGKTIVKVVDASTDEVIRQIPSEEIISIAKALDKLQGLLVQQKA